MWLYRISYKQLERNTARENVGAQAAEPVPRSDLISNRLFFVVVLRKSFMLAQIFLSPHQPPDKLAVDKFPSNLISCRVSEHNHFESSHCKMSRPISAPSPLPHT